MKKGRLFSIPFVEIVDTYWKFNQGHVLLRRVFSLIQKGDQNYWIFGCFYWYTTQFAITDTALNYSMTNNVKRRWRRREI